MGHREYIDPTINDITYISQVVITILAYIFNFLLIYIVHTSRRKDIGTYRTLITYFALSDLYYNTLHFLVYPIPEMYGNAFIMRGYGFYKDLLGVGLYIGSYGHAFPILIFHFFYRLLAIKYSQYLRFFPLFMFVLLLATLASNALWSISRFSVWMWFFKADEESIRVLTPLFDGSDPQLVVHTIDTADQHVQAVYWSGATFEGPRWRPLIGIGLVCACMTTTYTIIIFCSVLINKHLKERSQSPQSLLLHRQLFRSLIYQAFIPLFTAYYPAGTCCVLPVFGIAVYYISLIMPPACASHPLIDPLLLILSIPGYRRSFFTLLGFSKLLRHFDSRKPKKMTITFVSRSSLASPPSRSVLFEKTKIY